MKTIFPFILFLSFFICKDLNAQKVKSFNLKSPDNKLELKVSAGTHLLYEVSYKNTAILLPSAISMTIGKGEVLGENFKIRITKLITSHV